MKKTLILMLFLPGISFAGTHVQEGASFVAGQCVQAASGDSLTTTGSACGSGGGSGGIVSPGTFTWTNTFGISLSTLTVTSTATFQGPISGSGGVGNTGQILASQGNNQPPTFIDPIVSQATASNLNASCWINGSSNTIQGTVTANQGGAPWSTTISGNPTVFLATTSVSINGSSNTVQITGTPTVSVSNAPTVVQSTSSVNGSTVAIVNAVGTVIAVQSTGTTTITGTVTSTQGTAGTQAWPVASTSTIVVQSTVGVNSILNALPAGTNSLGTIQPGNIQNTTSWVVSSTWTVLVASNIYNNTLAPVATGQTQLSADENQRLLVTGIPRGQIKQATATLTSTTETVLISSGATGVFNDLCGCIFTNTSATATRIDLRGQGGAGTINNNFEIPPTDSRGFWPGCQNPFVQLQAASQWSVQLSGGVTDVRVTCQYIPIK